MTKKVAHAESASSVYAYESVIREWQDPVEDETVDVQIKEHIEKYLGQVEQVFYESISDTIHLDIYHVPPSEDRKLHCLITKGMSLLPMDAPKEAEQCKYAELIMFLPADWDLSEKALQDEKNYWPIRALREVARFPHENKSWFWLGHTVPNGEPPAPYGEGTQFCGVIALPPLLLEQEFDQLKIDSEKTIHFFCLIPLFKEEMDFKLKFGSQKLFEKLNTSGFEKIFDFKRGKCL